MALPDFATEEQRTLQESLPAAGHLGQPGRDGPSRQASQQQYGTESAVHDRIVPLRKYRDISLV